MVQLAYPSLFVREYDGNENGPSGGLGGGSSRR